MEQREEYNGHVIVFGVAQPTGTKFRNVRGRVEFYQCRTYRSVYFTGAVNKFTSEEDATQQFLTKVKGWIDRQRVQQSARQREVRGPGKL